VFNLAARSKITNIAMALRCASHIKQGKACSMADARATVALLDTGLKTARRRAAAEKKALAQSDNMVSRLLMKLGV
tara:strand:+ start:179 stop:406 length:228 start_codon:yes stop_codon:yes gene_type:complete